MCALYCTGTERDIKESAGITHHLLRFETELSECERGDALRLLKHLTLRRLILIYMLIKYQYKDSVRTSQ